MDVLQQRHPQLKDFVVGGWASWKVAKHTHTLNARPYQNGVSASVGRENDTFPGLEDDSRLYCAQIAGAQVGGASKRGWTTWTTGLAEN